MTKTILQDTFDVPLDTKWRLDEFYKDSEEGKIVDGVHILARLRGPMFVVNGDSLNKRHYSKALWENAISKNSQKLEDGHMLGAFGHEQPLDDVALGKGAASHRVSKLWIDESGVGMGEIIVFGTSSGKELNAMIRGGWKPKVSSRALGEFNGKKSATGCQIIDESTFDLKGFDIVQTPGVPTAAPLLVESFEEVKSEVTGNKNMSTDILESVIREKGKVEKMLEDASNTASANARENETLRLALSNKDKEIAELNKMVESKGLNENTQQSELTQYKTMLEKYEDLGSPKEILEAIEAAGTRLDEYRKYGTVDHLTEFFDHFNTLTEDYEELGSPLEISVAGDLLESYRELGDIEELADKLEELNNYKEVGSLEELEEVLAGLKTYAEVGTIKNVRTTMDSLKKYEGLGTVAELERVIAFADNLIDENAAVNRKKEAAEIAAKFKVPTETVEEMLSTTPKDKTISILESIGSSSIGSRYRPRDEKKNVDEAVTTKPAGEKTSLAESIGDGGASRARRIMEMYTKV